MEQNFYKDEFEQMLRDSTEDFRMYPSRKVWHSIYNDLHPDRKWPSFAVCLLLLTAILYVGVSNNNSISKSSRNSLLISSPPDGKSLTSLKGGAPQRQNNNDKSNSGSSNAASAKQLLTNIPKNDFPADMGNHTYPQASASSGTLISKSAETVALHAISINEKDASASASGNLNLKEGNVNFHENMMLTTQDAAGTDQHLVNTENEETNSEYLNKRLATKITRVQINEPDISLLTAGLKEINSDASGSDLKKEQANRPVLVSRVDKEWIEDFSLHNLRNRNKWKSNLSFKYYFAPSLNYRDLRKNNDYDPATSLLLRTSDDIVVNQQAAPGFEAGVQALVDLSRKLTFVAGLQFNYTNYITYAHALQHPTQTTVLMNDINSGFVMPVSYNSYYGNVMGSNLNRLNNSTNQISIPLGVNYELLGNQKIKWFMGADIQPSYIISGNAYLISSDSKNFVDDASLLRKFNVNTAFETFVSIKTPSGIDINVGPQLRYQLLSSYSKKYSYTEKLYNIGLKVGITKKL